MALTFPAVIDEYGYLVVAGELAELDQAHDSRPRTLTLGAELVAANLTGAAAHGRDVSSWDGAVAYGVYDFVINKATEGASYVSPGTAARQSAIRSLGKRYAAYHYAQPGSGGRQADHLLAVDGMPRGGDLPGMLDYEVNGLGVDFLVAFMRQYRTRVGVWPGLYTSLSRFRDELRGGRGWRQPGQLLWLAHYGVSTPGAPCDIWQWRGGPDLDTAFTPLTRMTVAALRPPRPAERGPLGYPYGPDPATPGSATGVRPLTSRAYKTKTGDTWLSILKQAFPALVNGQLTTNDAALKLWHRTHGGVPAYTGYGTFGVGAVIVLPSSSPGMLLP